MKHRIRTMSPRSKNLFIGGWFLTAAVLAMAPPVYWATSGSAPELLGLPFSFVYFVFTAAFVLAGLAVHYFVERERDELD